MRSDDPAYRRYIDSPQWREIRAAKLRQVDRCQDCGTQERLEAHHLTYARLGAERLEDLQILCHWCHMREHGLPVRDVPAVSDARHDEVEMLRQQQRALSDARALYQVAKAGNQLRDVLPLLPEDDQRLRDLVKRALRCTRLVVAALDA